MYESFFRLKKKPFELTPDCSFLFLNRRYREILAALVYGVTERRGLIVLVGDVGTGKTMMLHAMMERLDPAVRVARIVNPDLTFKQLLLMALSEFELASPDKDISKSKALSLLNEYARKQAERDANVVLVIDEAQNLKDSAIENLRMISNLETADRKLIQIILAGQTELDQKFAKNEWRQLVQRISLKRYSTQLSEEDAYQYIHHRMACAGGEGGEAFNAAALRLIWQFSEGIPRKINILCDNALLIGYGMGQPVIDEQIVHEVVADLTWAQASNAGPDPESPAAGTRSPEDPFKGDARQGDAGRSPGRRLHWPPDRRVGLAFLCVAVLAVFSLIAIWLVAGEASIVFP